MGNHNEVVLPFEEVDDVEKAGAFCAALQRAGVRFRARVDIITSIGGLSGIRGLVVEITGY